MKRIKILLATILFSGIAVSCIGDLDVTPIDPNTVIPEEVLNSQDAFTQLLAKCYQGLAVSSSDGPDGSPDIDGIDGGYGQYIRGFFHLQELTTDEAICCWNDGTLYDLHNMQWTASNEFIEAMYYRIFYQIGLCNEFIRQSNATEIAGYDLKEAYIAEARALRLLSYYHAIDLFGNVPFTTEDDSVGSTSPEQISRSELFSWLVNEALELINGTALAEIGANEYGRCDKGFVMMILAKLYLNAEVWTGTAMYSEAAEVCQEIIESYPALHNDYSELFLADNHLRTYNTTYGGDEIIFAVPQDGIYIQSYGVTNYIIFSSIGGSIDAASIGISSGWAGLSLTGAFTSLFDGAYANDARRLLYDGSEYEQYVDAIRRESDSWSNGYKSLKFKNINSDGTKGQATGFVDTDFPLFRTADAYLMYAECAKRGGGSESQVLEYFNAIRSRAGVSTVSSYTLQDVLDERGREFYFECHRRQDLIRFGVYTSEDYLWEFKGGVQEGQAVSDYRTLFPIPSADLNANGNLTQNPGY